MGGWRETLLVACCCLFPATVPAEGYPPLQPLIDATPEGETLIPPPGVYAGPVVIERPINLDGQHQVSIDNGGKGSVIILQTDGATVRNLRLTNSGESHNDIDAGVQVRGRFNVVKDNIIDNCLFGIDLQQSDHNVVRRNRISSRPLELGQRGDAIRLWYSFHNKITDNEISNARDTVVWYSANNTIARNTASHSRYSLHFMYSRYNLVEDNHYYNNAVGIFLMYSDGVVIRNNHIAHAAGPTGVGIGFKETSDLVVEGNEILYCASGIYLDISPFQPDTTNRFSHNLIAYNGIGIRFLNDWTGNVFRQNQFVDNLTQISVAGGKTANRNVWDGNYWSDYQGFDADADGVGDAPYELYAYADRLWHDEPYAQFFKGSPMLEVLDFLERLAPFSEPDMLVRDERPSMDTLIRVAETRPVEKDSLQLFRDSLGR
jgi:nitrous oxidase accessory protein